MVRASDRVARYLPAVILAVGACTTWATTGSVYRSPCTHVGVRPASDGLGDYAATVQISSDAPVCREVYPPARAARIAP